MFGFGGWSFVETLSRGVVFFSGVFFLRASAHTHTHIHTHTSTLQAIFVVTNTAVVAFATGEVLACVHQLDLQPRGLAQPARHLCSEGAHHHHSPHHTTPRHALLGLLLFRVTHTHSWGFLVFVFVFLFVFVFHARTHLSNACVCVCVCQWAFPVFSLKALALGWKHRHTDTQTGRGRGRGRERQDRLVCVLWGVVCLGLLLLCACWQRAVSV